MSNPILRTLLLSALLVLPLATHPGSSGAAPPNAILPSVTGFWSGGFSSVTGLSGFASLDVTDQDQRRFQGAFALFYPPQPIYPPSPIRILGTVSHSGEISLVGRNDFAFLEAHGQTDGEVMNLNFLLHFSDGSMDMGTASTALPTGNGP